MQSSLHVAAGDPARLPVRRWSPTDSRGRPFVSGPTPRHGGVPKPPTYHLSIFLAKPTVTDPLDLLRTRSAATKIAITPSVAGYVVVPGPRRGAAPWQTLFAGTPAHAAIAALRSSSVGAALVLRHAGRCFALTWGHPGRAQIDLELIEDRFGLKTTLSAIPANQVKSIEHRSFDALTRNTVSQGSRSGGVHDYGIDTQRDLLRAVQGTPTDRSLGSRLHGKDALVAATSLTLAQLPARLKSYLHLFTSDGYKKDFEWIDQLAEERSAAVIAHCNDQLVAKLITGDVERIWLTPPDVLPWQRVATFSYAGDRSRKRFVELELSDWRATITNIGDLDLAVLQSRRVRWHDATTGDAAAEWPLYKTLHAEIDGSNTTHLLSEGKWYRVNSDFVAEINKSVASLQTPSTLPSYRKSASTSGGHASENEYNREVHGSAPARYAFLDRKNIFIGGGSNQVEPCDLFESDRTFIHVKRYNAAQDMSHLFFQGMNSAQLFLNSEAFRKDLLDKLPSSHKKLIPLKPPVTPGQFRVRYVVIREAASGKTAAVDRLPFFSRLSLHRAANAIRSTGMQVDLMHVDSV